jgi:hypothetical protein
MGDDPWRGRLGRLTQPTRKGRPNDAHRDRIENPTAVIGFDEPFCVIGERINPTGRKKLASRTGAGDFSTVEADAWRRSRPGRPCSMSTPAWSTTRTRYPNNRAAADAGR